MNQKIPLLAIIGLSLSGCGQPSVSIGPAASSNAIAATTSIKPTNSEPNQSDGNPAIAELGEGKASAPATTSDTPTIATPEPDTVPPAVQAAQVSLPVVQPSTAAASVGAIDLLTFPRINQKGVMDQGSTYVYYMGESSVKSADAFYQAEFKSHGWEESRSLTPSSEQYTDRTYSKDGYYVRATISSGSKAGEIGVNLANLGNIDARLLPKMEDAESTESTAVNAGHKTAHSIIEVAESLSRKLTDLGWQEVRDFFTPDSNVPHYRSIKYRKNAMRINLGIYRDPKNPADKTIVFYHSEFAIPFDIPTPDHRKLLKLDLTSMRAAFESDVDRSTMLEMFEKPVAEYGWKLKNAEQFQNGEAASLLISTGPKMGIIARSVEEKDIRSIAMEYVPMPEIQPKDVEFPNEQVAFIEPDANRTNTKSDVEKQIDQIQAEVASQIDVELNKVLGSLRGESGSASSASLADIQAKASSLMKSLKNEASSPTEITNKSKSNPFVASDDKEPVEAADLGIKASQCVIKTDKETYTLKHLLAYNQVEDGVTTKVLMFSNKVLNEDKLRRMLASGKSVSIHDLGGFDNSPTLEMKISGDSVMVNAGVSGWSMSTNSSDIKSTVRYRGGRMQGRVVLDKAMKMGEESFAFHAQVNQQVLQVDWKPASQDRGVELTADAEYEFPLPENVGSKSIEGTKFLKQIEANVEAPLKSVQAFYRKEFEARGFTETRLQKTKENTFSYANTNESAEVRLTENSGKTTIAMSVRNNAAAKAEKMIPSPGKGLALMGNLSKEPVEIKLGGKTMQLPAGLGALEPKDAMRIEVAPGKYQVEWKTKGGKSAKEQLEITADTTWGIIFDLDFQSVMRLY